MPFNIDISIIFTQQHSLTKKRNNLCIMCLPQTPNYIILLNHYVRDITLLPDTQGYQIEQEVVC